jgi:hypothetical protein
MKDKPTDTFAEQADGFIFFHASFETVNLYKFKGLYVSSFRRSKINME